MRRGLWWALAGALALSGLALLWDDAPDGALAVVQPRLAQRADALAAAGERGRESPRPVPLGVQRGVVAPLPEHWPSAPLEPARRDVFAPVLPPAPAVVAPPPVQVAPPPPAPPPVVAMPYRYLGRMVGPEGVPMVYLAAGDSALLAKVGEALSTGFVVESIDNEAVHLLHAATQQRAVVPIPQAP